VPYPVASRKVEVNVLSVCGPAREENQDAAIAWRGDDGQTVLIVADGMGGHAAGREAAEIVVRVALDVLRQEQGEGRRSDAGLHHAFAAAQEAVRAAQAAGAGAGNVTLGMGATAVMAVVADGPGSPVLHLAHAGDSRAYLYRGSSLIRLTSDHSLVGQLVRDGLLREEEAFGHPDSNVVQMAIGQDGPLDPEVQLPLSLNAGDRVLLSSDGLHGALPDPEIAAVLARSGSALESCQDLLDAALAARSQDNITIGCLRLAPDPERRRITRIESVPRPPEGGTRDRMPELPHPQS
jgi:serine/threonine protein phosphatase PrpC